MSSPVQTLLANKGSFTKMDVFLGRQDRSQMLLIRSQPTPGIHLENSTVISLPQGEGECRGSSFPISLSDRAPNSIRRNQNTSCNLWGLFTSHNGFWQLRQQGTVQWHSCYLPASKGRQKGKKTHCWYMLTSSKRTTPPEDQAAFYTPEDSTRQAPIKNNNL